MKVVAIIQARMGSTRLPGKVAKLIKEKTVLEHVIKRLSKCSKLNRIVIATTTNPDDDEIITIAENINTPYFRGSEQDVLSRYYLAAKESLADIIVRITSDCPVIDPQIIDAMVDEFELLNRGRGQVDYMSNTLELSFPRGLDVEIFTFDSLEKAYRNGNQGYEREHVTPHIYRNPTMFNLTVYKNDIDYSAYRWTLDTKEDLEVITAIYEGLYSDNRMFYFRDILNYIEENPHLSKINSDIRQKALGE